MKDWLLALMLAIGLAVGFFYEPPASASVELIHVEKVHVVEPWECRRNSKAVSSF